MFLSSSSARSEIAISVPASGLCFGPIARHSMPRFAGNLAKAGGRGSDLRARQQSVFRVVEFYDLVHALDADIERAVIVGERLGVEPSARGQRAPVGAEHRRHLGIGDPGWRSAAIDDAAAQPLRLVGQRDEIRAVGGDF